MVVRTPTLQSVKRKLLPSIHQPLPLSKQQSQQLLNTITASFRKNLDLEHPWQSVDARKLAPTSHDGLEATSRQLTEHVRTRPTDQHLRSILANPLFSQPAHDKGTQTPTGMTSIPNQLYIFDAAVAKGLMNTRRALGFLITIQKAIKSSSNSQHTMANTGAGLRVLRWLQSTDQEAEMRFLTKNGFVATLVHFLYAEGLEHVLWEWLARIASPSFTAFDSESASWKRSEHPLSQLYSAMTREMRPSAHDPKRSMDSSLTNYLVAHEILSDQSRIARVNLKESWVVLSWQATVEAWKRAAPTTSLFEDFVESGRPWKRELDLAHLDLHHPSNPTSDAALDYMHRRPSLTFRPETPLRVQESHRQRVICLALDAVDSLKQVGNAAEVTWVERFLASVSEHLTFGTATSLRRESPLPLGRPDRYTNFA